MFELIILLPRSRRAPFSHQQPSGTATQLNLVAPISRHTVCAAAHPSGLTAKKQEEPSRSLASPRIVLGKLRTKPGGPCSLRVPTKNMAATFLPAPRHSYQVHSDEPPPSALLDSAPKKQVPPYGSRQSFVPRSQEDFGDGGAFPEIHVAQFPLEMGRPAAKKKAASGAGGGGGGVGGISGLGNNSGSTAIVAVDVDEAGKVRRGRYVLLAFVCGCEWRAKDTARDV